MLPQSSINYYSPQLSENCESLTANNVLKRSKKMEGLQRFTKISKNIQKYQGHSKHPRDTRRYPIILKTSKASPETPKDIQYFQRHPKPPQRNLRNQRYFVKFTIT